ncbi:MAG: N-acetyltransferase [Candidatus Omnitrophota bacterium]
MITVRGEKRKDIAVIRDINEKAFGQRQEADIIDKLRDKCSYFLSLVAEIDGCLVGHILFTPAVIEGEDGSRVEGVGLAPMAVLPQYQKQGVGSALVRAGFTELEKKGCLFVIVLGHAEYYPRFGFEPASRYGIGSQWDVPEDVFMILMFDGTKMEGVKGTAKYRPEFDQTV